MFHEGDFWNLVGLFSILLMGAEMTLSGKIITAPKCTKSGVA